MTDYKFSSPNIVSISSVCDIALRKAIIQSDYIRNETLRRLTALPSYQYKTLAWKNRYYDYFKRQIIKEAQ